MISMALPSFFPGKAAGLTVNLHPVAAVGILDAHMRRPDSAARVVGCVLGYEGEGSVLEVLEVFAVPHRDDVNHLGEVVQAKLDVVFQAQMAAAKKASSSNLQVVGWFRTGGDLNQADVAMQSFFGSSDAGFVASPGSAFPGPVLVKMDASGQQEAGMRIEAFHAAGIRGSQGMLAFTELAVATNVSGIERVALRTLVEQRNDEFCPGEGGSVGTEDDGDELDRALKTLERHAAQAMEFVAEVRNEDKPADAAYARQLLSVLRRAKITRVDVAKLCTTRTDDALLVAYLAATARVQVELADKVGRLYMEDEQLIRNDA